MQELYNLAKNLKTLREENHYTQQYVADQLAIKAQSYRAYEIGITVPTLKHFIQLAKLYEVSLNELIE
jgi:transcriptional regulator with XRE-family HTH domain